jgi:hypothetical protein
MKWLKLIKVAMIPVLYAAATYGQEVKDLDSAARGRIEQARASVVTVKVLDQQNASDLASGWFSCSKRSHRDGPGNRQEFASSSYRCDKAGTIRVLSAGNYFLPYVLVETQTEISPLSLADSERVAVNDAVYMLGESGKIVSGRITGTTTIKNTQAYLIDLPINSNNKGAPVFDRHGEVIGIATKSPDGQNTGLAWPSQVLATLTHLGEPGRGAGSGDGPRFGVGTAPGSTQVSTAARVDTKPVRLNSPEPRYTEAARAKGIQGLVIMSVLVGEDGSVKSVRVVRGLPRASRKKR